MVRNPIVFRREIALQYGDNWMSNNIQKKAGENCLYALA
jgi:hypothetical protein